MYVSLCLYGTARYIHVTSIPKYRPPGRRASGDRLSLAPVMGVGDRARYVVSTIMSVSLGRYIQVTSIPKYRHFPPGRRASGDEENAFGAGIAIHTCIADT